VKSHWNILSKTGISRY